jgi:hypothetical protein
MACRYAHESDEGIMRAPGGYPGLFLLGSLGRCAFISLAKVIGPMR